MYGIGSCTRREGGYSYIEAIGYGLGLHVLFRQGLRVYLAVKKLLIREGLH